MKIADLIRILQTYPQDLRVVVDGYEDGYDDLVEDLHTCPRDTAGHRRELVGRSTQRRRLHT